MVVRIQYILSINKKKKKKMLKMHVQDVQGNKILTCNKLLVKSKPYPIKSSIFDVLNFLSFQTKKIMIDSEKTKFVIICKYVTVKHSGKEVVFLVRSTPILNILYERPLRLRISFIIDIFKSFARLSRQSRIDLTRLCKEALFFEINK